MQTFSNRKRKPSILRHHGATIATRQLQRMRHARLGSAPPVARWAMRQHMPSAASPIVRSRESAAQRPASAALADCRRYQYYLPCDVGTVCTQRRENSTHLPGCCAPAPPPRPKPNCCPLLPPTAPSSPHLPCLTPISPSCLQSSLAEGPTNRWRSQSPNPPEWQTSC